MLRIRLRRTGQKHQPSYRLVVADKNARRDGDFVEIVGHYNPRTEPVDIVVNEERIRYWIGVGAQPSDTVHRILHSRGLITAAPKKIATKPSKAEREAAAAAEKAAAEAREAAKAEAEAAAKAAEEAAAAAAAAAEAPAAEADAPAAE
ncbi:MAG: 30S ribosomal protein S16 [Dehalococcoidia bacterium]